MNLPFDAEAGDAAIRQLEERVRARLAVVEQQNRRLQGRSRLLGFGLLLTLALVALIAVAPESLAIVGIRPEGQTIEAQSFRLVDSNGLARGEWSVDENGNSRLSLLDPQRRPRLNVAVLETGSPGIALLDAENRRRAALGLLGDGTTTLVFADVKEVPRAVFGLTQTDAANLILADADGVTRMGFGLDGAGMGSVMLPDESTGDDEPENVP